MNTITFDTLLKIGTVVQVKFQRGVVIVAKMVQAIPCGVIALHTIEFTHGSKIGRNSLGVKNTEFEPLKMSHTKQVNYSFIRVV